MIKLEYYPFDANTPWDRMVDEMLPEINSNPHCHINGVHLSIHNEIEKCGGSIYLNPDAIIIIEFNNMEDYTLFKLKWG